MQDLWNLGFDEFFASQCENFSSLLQPCRITNVEKNYFKAFDGKHEHLCQLSGKFEFLAMNECDLPCVGDWILMRGSGDGIKGIEHVLTRKSLLFRKEAGKSSKKQLIAANIDYVFIMQSCNADFSANRLTRYLC
ncbi:hypothetical protein MEO40_26925, partial [Dolichospermum sp. ST_sed1]|nr:hypothetical protein [Dolichospermum sp. ST_sed1]